MPWNFTLRDKQEPTLNTVTGMLSKRVVYVKTQGPHSTTNYCTASHCTYLGGRRACLAAKI
jgi:hypothetical protein